MKLIWTHRFQDKISKLHQRGIELQKFYMELSIKIRGDPGSQDNLDKVMPLMICLILKFLTLRRPRVKLERL